MKVRLGCSGFPVARARYFREFSSVEILQSLYQPPGIETAQRWRQEAPKNFVFSVVAWQAITHLPHSVSYARMAKRIPPKDRARMGHFKDNLQVREAWRSTAALARTLSAKFVVFLTPPTFYPNATHLDAMYRFFRNIDRGETLFVWQPSGAGWTDTLVAKVCRDLKITHATDPLKRASVYGSVPYFRLRGAAIPASGGRGQSYGDGDFYELCKKLDAQSSYLYFANAARWQDARSFRDYLTRPYQGKGMAQG